MSDWQPIETAPRDGTWFLIARFPLEDRPMYEVGCFDPLTVHKFEEAGGGLYRRVEYSAYDWTGFDNFHRATHWAPLPAPPADQEGE